VDLQILALKKNAHIIQQLCVGLRNFVCFKNVLILTGLPEAHFPLPDLQYPPIKEIYVFDLGRSGNGQIRSICSITTTKCGQNKHNK